MIEQPKTAPEPAPGHRFGVTVMQYTLRLFLLLTALLSGCISQQIGQQVAYVKHTTPLRGLFEPHLQQTELPRLICRWTHNGSHYCVRADAKKTQVNWYVEVRHTDGSCYRHHNPEPLFCKTLPRQTGDDIRVKHRHKGEQLILTLQHRDNTKVTLHAHNLGLIHSFDTQSDTAATATLQQVVQQAYRINLLYVDGREYQLSEWEQQAMRRLLKGAHIGTLTEAKYACKLQFYDDDRKLLFSLPISEYHVTSGICNHPAPPFMPGTILAGDYHKILLNAWWSGVCLRLNLPSLQQQLVEQSMSELRNLNGNTITNGFLRCSGVEPDDLLRDSHKNR